MTSGSCRSTARSAAAKSTPIEGRIGIWVAPGKVYSIGSSRVTMLRPTASMRRRRVCNVVVFRRPSPGGENEATGLGDEVLDPAHSFAVEAEIVEVGWLAAARQKPDRNLFSVLGSRGSDPQIELHASGRAKQVATVLRGGASVTSIAAMTLNLETRPGCIHVGSGSSSYSQPSTRIRNRRRSGNGSICRGCLPRSSMARSSRRCCSEIIAAGSPPGHDDGRPRRQRGDRRKEARIGHG